MMAVVLAALLAATGQPARNPLIGTWTAERPANTRFNVAAPPTMTITRDAILFEQTGRITDRAAITGFDRDGAFVTANTRRGGIYRFRFTTVNRMCRVPSPDPNDRMTMPEPVPSGPCWERTPPMMQDAKPRW